MKKITFNNILWLFIIGIVLYQIYSYSSEYFMLKNYQYGEKYNEFREKNEIPLIDNEMEPLKMPVDNFWGMIWINENIVDREKPIIHKIKIIDASEKNGWQKESDDYLYFINDTTDFILKIESKKTNNKINFEYKLGKTDSRRKKIEDYEANKYYDYSEKRLNKLEFDSIKKTWKIK